MPNFWHTPEVRQLHIELTNACNAACPMCVRFYRNSPLPRPDLEIGEITLDKFQQFFPPGHGIVHRGRKDVLGRHAVVHRQHLGTGRAGQVGAHRAVGLEAAEKVAAPVEVQHGALGAGHAEPFGRAQALGGIGGHGGVADVLGRRRVAVGQLVHLAAGHGNVDRTLAAVLELPAKDEVGDDRLNAHAFSAVYLDNLKCRVLKRYAKVKLGHSDTFRPWALRYQLLQPEFQTVDRRSLWICSVNCCWAWGLTSRTLMPRSFMVLRASST